MTISYLFWSSVSNLIWYILPTTGRHKQNSPILQMRNWGPERGKGLAQGHTSKFVVDRELNPWAQALSISCAAVPFAPKMGTTLPSYSTLRTDPVSQPCMSAHLHQSFDNGYSTLYTGAKLPNPLRPLMVLKGNKRFQFSKVGSSDNVTISYSITCKYP